MSDHDLPPLRRRLVARLRSLWTGVRERSRVEDEMREEFRVHIEMRTEDLVRQGMSRAAASRRAHREFGHVETHREQARAARGLRWVDQIRFSWIDVRLGARMMLKYPGLTVVAVLALAVGIPTGLAPMYLARALDRPLPEDPDDRIRAVRFWDASVGAFSLPTYGDYSLLAEELESFDHLGAYRNGSYNVGAAGGDGSQAGAPVRGAEVTASALAILQVPPLMGRLFDHADETPGAADVAVVGYRLWQSRFGGDPEIVGRTIRVGSTPHTVVGVMPDGFFFPVADQLWLPLPREASAMPGEGRSLRIVARLADGVSGEQAHTEVASIALPPEHPARRGPVHRELEVVPFSYTYVGLPRGGFEAVPEFHFMRLLGWVLLLVACGNVSMLVFARTATRFRELAVRTALGAGRWRIVSQVFTETLVLAVVAGGVGLFLIDQVMTRMPWHMIAGEASLPYWVDLGVPAGIIPAAAAFTILSATIAGVVPALSVTRGDIRASIRSADAARSGIRFGGLTGGLIVTDVALAVGVIGFAFGITRYLNELTASDVRVGIPADEYLAVELRLSANDLPEGGEESARLARLQQQLAERLAEEPEVNAVLFADALPRMNHRSRVVRVSGATDAGEDGGRWVRVARVDADFFDQLDQPILAGRGFDRADAEAPIPPVIVNQIFVDEMLGGAAAVGQYVRFSSSREGGESPAHEIVGVVGRLGMNTVSRRGARGLYLVEPPGGIHPLQLGVHVGGGPERFVPRLREIVTETDPSAILGTPVVLGDVQQGDWYIALAIVAGMGLLVTILVALAASGIYAIISFSVSERTREIGIRSALGASRHTLVYTILRRALVQLGVGALLGIPLATWFALQIQDPDLESSIVLTEVARSVLLGLTTVSLVGLASCVAPARRALAIEANDALRAE